MVELFSNFTSTLVIVGVILALGIIFEKQLIALSWWHPDSPYCRYDGIICDGAVRSGKTTCMSISFVAWAFYYFNDTNFALCGKTIASLKRNIVTACKIPTESVLFNIQELHDGLGKNVNDPVLAIFLKVFNKKLKKILTQKIWLSIMTEKLNIQMLQIKIPFDKLIYLQSEKIKA